MQIDQHNFQLKTLKGERAFLADIHLNENAKKQPVVIYVHGFKGFKDFGATNLVAQHFAKQHIAFVKFNFAYNGTTISQATEFADLDAFGENNFCKELDDLKVVIDWVFDINNPYAEHFDLTKVHLIGHSRGGGIVLLKAAADKRINKICTWASVADYGINWSDEVIENWKTKSTIYVLNGRTKQQMPLNYQLVENYFKNLNRLEIPVLAKKIQQHVLIVHGTGDTSVPFNCAEKLNNWISNATLFSLENANHTFGMKHPWDSNELPKDLLEVSDRTISFFKPS